MKKIIALVLAVVMCLALVACGGAEESKAPESQAPASQAPASQAPASQAPASQAPEAPAYPDGKNITLICPWSAGGGSDNGVRLLVPYLEKQLGTSITVINPTGGSGWVGWEQMLKAEADGLTISLVNWPTLLPGYLDPAYERDYSLDDFQMVANHVSDDCVIVINKDETRYTTAEEFFAYAKENVVTYGTTGNGTDDHIMMCRINAALGTQLEQVASNGWADNSAAIQGGHLDATAANVGEVMNLAAQGEVKVLCVFADEENPLLPGVPTFNSLGLSDTKLSGASMRGYAVKAGTDAAVLEIIEKAFEAAINDPAHVEEMAKLGLKVDFIGSADYTANVKDQETVLLGMSDIMGW